LFKSALEGLYDNWNHFAVPDVKSRSHHEGTKDGLSEGSGIIVMFCGFLFDVTLADEISRGKHKEACGHFGGVRANGQAMSVSLK